MLHYLRRLRYALQNRNYYPYYHEDDRYPMVWELDRFILNMVRVNLPNYKNSHPLGMTEEEWNAIREKMVGLANGINAYEEMRGWRFYGKKKEAREGFTDEEIAQKRKDFADLVGKHFRDLWD